MPEDPFTSDPKIASRIMLDNWLLYGFEELIGGRAVFLNCTRETLLSGFLSLLPHSAVFEIPEAVNPDEEVLTVCRSLKAAGYRFALDDFESPGKHGEISRPSGLYQGRLPAFRTQKACSHAQ